MSLRTTVLGQMSKIRELQAADHRRQTVISELLRIDHRRSIEISELRTALQGQVTALQGHVTALQAHVTTLQGQQGLAGARDTLRSTNGDDSYNSRTGVRRTERATHECTYTDFLKCQPLPFKGTEGKTLMKMMTKRYCPRNEIRKLEMELWYMKVKGTDLASYTQRYQELALLCGRMFFEESDKIEKYVGGVRRTERAARECTYTDFLKCQPLPFKGTEGVASLSQWCKRMEFVFHISNCTAENQVKFATCTLHSVALTWWNTHVQTVGHEAAYSMSWKTLMKMMTDKYCPRNEIKKLEVELWELKVKGTDLASYTQRFQELALLYGRMFSEEADKIEKYVRGLPDMIHESVVASKPKTMQEAIEIATELMDKKVRTFSERETASKRKFKNTSRTNRNQQQQQQSSKRQNTGRVYTVASGEKKQYGDPNPYALNAII
nr:hypothetical protein [Tanacetum cinerariifolium]